MRDMKNILTALIMILILSGCETMRPSQEVSWQERAFNSEIYRIDDMYKNGKLTRIEANREALSAAKSYYPNDHLLISLRSRLLEYAERLDRNEISIEKYFEITKMASEQFDQANTARYTAVQEESNRRANTAATAIMLQGVGRSFQNATQPVGVQCHTSGYGAYATTYCN